MSKKFGALVKSHRLRLGISLREFCLRNQIDAGNFSRVERGLYPPPESRDRVEQMAKHLELKEGSDEWTEFFDVASVERGAIPSDLLNDEELVEKLPVFFRTLRATAVDPKALERLVDQIRST